MEAEFEHGIPTGEGMHLRLSLVASDAIQPGQVMTVVLDEAGGIIGRGEECDWQLHCPNRLISRRHAVVLFENDSFQLYDASSNGVYLNDASEPLGAGGKAAIGPGDRVRMGDFVIQLENGDDEATSGGSMPLPTDAAVSTGATPTPEPAATATPAEPDQAEIAESASTAGLAESLDLPSVKQRKTDLGTTRDAFTPPAANIPEDWDLELSGYDTAATGSPAVSVNRQFDALEPRAVRELWNGLGITNPDDQPRHLSPEQAYAVGAALRVSLRTMLTLRREHDRLERRYLPSARVTEKELFLPGDQKGVDAAVSLLLDDDHGGSRARFLRAIQRDSARFPGVSTRLIEALLPQVIQAIDQLGPERIARRARRRPAPGRVQRLLARTSLRLFPAAVQWRLYRRWFQRYRTRNGRLAARLTRGAVRRALSGRQNRREA